MNIELVKKWIFDPSLGKVVTAGIGFLLIGLMIRVLQNWVGGRVKNTEFRYRAKKMIGFTGYLVAFIFLGMIFSDRLSRFTVAFGVAGAGIAFALQEVIASVAGWIAVSFGNFYSPGDRIQLGGTKGDVIDIGVLRTTLMEVGQWVNADQYNGRIVRVANSFVFNLKT
jgi:small-conductance mechanosensitive channel